MELHEIEPELKRSPPRRVRRRGTRGFGTLFSQFFLVPIMALCLGFPLLCIDMILVRARGPIVTCHIVDKYREFDKEEDEWRYYLAYRVIIGGKDHTGRELVEIPFYKSASIGDSMRLQVSPIISSFDSVLLVPGRNVWSDVYFIVFASLLMLGGGAAMAWYIYVLPARRRNLVVRGIPIVGQLVDKSKFEGSKTQSYTFIYSYQPFTPANALGSSTASAPAANAPATLIGTQSVRRSDWDAPQIGEAYTVLYNPDKPQFSVLYLYGDYVVV